MVLPFLTDKKYIVISIIGSHAGEDVAAIFSRKQEELKRNGKTYWLIKSFRAKTSQIQKLCQEADKGGADVWCLFIESSAKNGARPTIHDSVARHISDDEILWRELSDARITGKLDRQSTALVFDDLQVIPPEKLDLWNYSEFETGKPLKLQLGASTICCVLGFSKGMASRLRNVVAVGKFTKPYAVWVK